MIQIKCLCDICKNEGKENIHLCYQCRAEIEDWLAIKRAKGMMAQTVLSMTSETPADNDGNPST